MDDNEEFESGYGAAEEPQPEAKEALKEEPQQEATPVPEKAEEPKVDPLQEIRDLLEKQNARIRNTEGHIGGLNHNLKQMQETLAASNAAAQRVAEAPTQAQVKEAMSNPKEWDELKADFPEWSAATEKLLDARLSTVGKVDMSAIQKVEEQLRNETASIRKEIIDSTLDVVLPNWTEEINKPEFVTWMQAQPAETQALASSDKVCDAAKMLRLYDQFRSKPPEPVKSNVAARQKRIEAAVTPKGTGGFTPAKTDMDEFEAGYAGR